MFAECDTDVSAEVDGRIQKSFEEGDVVSEGDSLVWLDDERYRSIAQENLANWRLAIANLKTLQIVKEEKKLFHDGVISSQEYDDVNNQMQERANVDHAKASLSIAYKNLKDTKIKAPISGIISSKLVDVGEYVKRKHLC